MQRETPAAPRKRKPTDVCHSDKTLSPMNVAGESTLQRVRADDSPDDLEAVVPPQRPSASGRRSVSRPLFGAKAGAGKSGRDPQTVEERTAALLLERVCQGDLRPERLDPVWVNGQYHCPFCFLANADGSAGQYCVPIKSQEPYDIQYNTGHYTGVLEKEWDTRGYNNHLTSSHGFQPLAQGTLLGGLKRFQKTGVGTGGNPTNPGVWRGTKPIVHKDRRPVWKLRWGVGFEIESVRVGRKKY